MPPTYSSPNGEEKTMRTLRVDPLVTAVVIGQKSVIGYNLSMFFSNIKHSFDQELQRENIIRKIEGEKCRTCISCTHNRCFFAFKKYPNCYLER